MKKSGFSDDGMVGVGHTLRVSATDPFVAGRSVFSSRRPRRFSKRGQQVAEYMLMFAAVSAAFLAIHVYARRGLQARIKELVDVEVGPQEDSSPLTVPKAEGWSSSNMISEVYSSSRDIKEGEQMRSWFETGSFGSGVTVSVMNENMSTTG